ncbi:hypothetical protein LNP04_12985 [Chryseobacterium sp. C-71]|uniref:DUF6705 family protein n=1 Tax=Chryseobacterium sp. C-71 TaxID=2893882 RepID=UPI001E50D0A6|nr:DUF6705 family protein [Chryseobacterium sp. C-71]UFH30890.1 hypothetical protein LNP04_12985 [Chryseobacterium sp. C-71]
MKNIILVLSFLMFTTISCSAQNTMSLEEAAVYPEQLDGRMLPPNTTYLKDINNSLNKYVGTWRGNLNGKKYEYNLIKKINDGSPDGKVRRDRLVGRLRITDSNGNVVYNTFTEPDDNNTNFFGKNFQSDLKAYKMYFVGNSVGCAEYGDVYLRIKPTTPNQMTILMLPDNDIVVEGVCPANFQPTIPYKQLIHLTKQ